jgi:hypothetical protein
MPRRSRAGKAIPTYKIMAEDGTWLTNLRLAVPTYVSATRSRGRDMSNRRM